jgi:hypothetical protein
MYRTCTDVCADEVWLNTARAKLGNYRNIRKKQFNSQIFAVAACKICAIILDLPVLL